MDRKKVLWIASSYPRCEADSAGIFLKYLAQAIQQEGFDLHVLAPDHSAVAVSKQDNPVKDYRFRYFFPRHLQLLAYGSGILTNLQGQPWLFLQVPFFMIFQFFSTWRLMRQLEPDLIHAHWVFPQGWIAALLGKWRGVPVIVTVHGSDAHSLRHSLLAKIKRWTLRNCSSWTSNTSATAQVVGNNLPVPKIIPMGVDLKRFNSGLSLKKTPGTSVLLFVGRLVEIKGLRDLITAFSLMDKSLQSKTELWIIGDGAERQSLETLARTLNLTGRITFYGRLPNDLLPDYYATADIFIAPSIIDSSGSAEGQGVILLEALASGTPIISTKTGGISEMIQHGKTGWLVEPNDPVDLKNAMERLLMDKEFRDSLAAAGKKIIPSYDWKVIANKFSSLYYQHLDN